MALLGKKRLRGQVDDESIAAPAEPLEKRRRNDDDDDDDSTAQSEGVEAPSKPQAHPVTADGVEKSCSDTPSSQPLSARRLAEAAVGAAVEEAVSLDSLEAEEVYEEAQRVLEGKGELVGRTAEREQIAQFWERAVVGRRAASLYISGAPGCGKTASVMALKRAEHRKARALPREERPQVAYLNCMKLVNPRQAIFQAVAAKLGMPDVAQSTAEAALRTHVTSGGATAMTVLICDEIDALESSDVLYSLFELPALKGSSLVLIGIANALVLTEEVLPRLKHSSCKPETLYFAPYRSEQLMEIVLERLAKAKIGSLVGLFEEDALHFCAGKVSSQTSDVRTALQMMKQAVAVAQEQYEKDCDERLGNEPEAGPRLVQVSIMHVNLASKAKSPVVRVIKQLPMQQKLLLCSIATLALQADGTKALGGLEAVMRTFKSLPMARAALRDSEAAALVDLLREQSLVAVKGIALNVNAEDVAMALALEPYLPVALRELLTR